VILGTAFALAAAIGEKRPHIAVRALYGGIPVQIFERGRTLDDYGINAVWLGSGSITEERFALLKKHGTRVFAEFNTLHEAGYLKQNPDAAPIGADGKVSPPPDGWQGICPTHPGYRRYRMDAFRDVLERFPLDGIWLDYHHSHASWEQAEPNMPDTCFCSRCINRFSQEMATPLPAGPASEVSRLLRGQYRERWLHWRTQVFTDWVREFREILDRRRTGALLGTFHNPWSDSDFNGARLEKLAIDLKSQSRYIDVFSPMPYHARFGHASDPAWISRQTVWLGAYLGIQGKEGDRRRIWPIVQLADWGEPVPVSQVREVLDHGTRPPATGVIVFAWGRLYPQWEKVEQLGRIFHSMRP